MGVGGIDREERRGADGIVERALVDVALTDAAVLAVAEVERLTELEDIEVVALDGHVVGVDAEGIAAILRIHRLDLVPAEDTVLARVGKTHRELVVSSTAGHVE